MRTISTLLFLLLVSVLPAVAEQTSEWRSSSGATVRMVGTENQTFTIYIYGNNPQPRMMQASWVSTTVPKSFTYILGDGGGAYFGKFTTDYTIRVEGRGQVTEWQFVRWLNRS
jgi:hypothetical protein